MNSYDILNVKRTSSDKEIEIAYMDLKKKYDPHFNTSIHSYKKYREILKAYEDIKDEQSRIMYDLKDQEEIRIKEDITYKLYNYNEIKVSEETIDYSVIEDNRHACVENIELYQDISYLYYLLNLNYDVSYTKKVKCDKCNEFSICPVCDGEKIVEHDEKFIWCPTCLGRGKVSKECDVCHGQGYNLEESIICCSVDEVTKVFKDEGNNYNGVKSDLILHFNFYDKDEIRVKDDCIVINYKMSLEETVNGIEKSYGDGEDSFSLVISSFVDDGYVEEINFKNYKLKFIFTNEVYNGKNITKYLLFNKKYLNNTIFFNSDYTNYSFSKSEDYYNEYVINTSFSVDHLGEKGLYGGKDGKLYIEVILSDVKDIIYSNDVSVVKTSKLFNLLGGNSLVYNYGFKGRNSVIYKHDKYYVLTGSDEYKCKLKDYFLIKVLMCLLWILIPLLIFIMPYNKAMFITLISSLIIYLILINLVMEVRV